MKVNVPYNTNLLMQEWYVGNFNEINTKKNIPDYKEINVSQQPKKFMLQDFDKEALFYRIKRRRQGHLIKSEKNTEKYALDKTFGNKIIVRYIKPSVK